MSRDIENEIVAAYRRTFKGIYGYCMHRLFTSELAEDAASAVYLRFVEKFDSLKGKTPEQIRNWLYGTASNVTMSHLRDKNRRRQIAAAIAMKRRQKQKDDAKSNGELDWPELYEALSRLQERHQDIVTLRFFEGLKTSSIAEALGMRHVTIRVLLSRAMKKLRWDLERHIGQ